QGFEATAIETCLLFGIDLKEMDSWYCCGTVHSLAADDLIHQLAPVRNLSRVKALPADRVVTLCSMCYKTLKRDDLLLQKDSDKRKKLQSIMDRGEALYDGGEVKVFHLLELLRDEVGWAAIREKALPGLQGLKVASYYGCLLLRPEEAGIDDPENPSIMEELVRALGGEPVEFPWKTECCGAYLTATRPETISLRSREILSSAARRGAEVIATSCPLCFFNLEERRERMEGNGIPVFYFAELMALALGLGLKEEHRKLHKVDPQPLLARLELKITTKAQRHEES
ncbi:MAG: heterodisulfide reductase-related iron-sulfur binding cluster, partial [Candidatus Aureabacteria bacterium]|nr:heterodisulfide reductase-related iron-sulfur binding cluster [Candidatus Auribacterota bacterium]